MDGLTIRTRRTAYCGGMRERGIDQVRRRGIFPYLVKIPIGKKNQMLISEYVLRSGIS